MTREARTLKASSLGRVLSAFLSHYFGRYVDYGFTSGMEEGLDDVSGASDCDRPKPLWDTALAYSFTLAREL